MSFLVCFTYPFAVVMNGWRCSISSNVRFGHVAKYPFLMDCRRFWRTGLNIVEWYHLDRSGFVLSDRSLGDTGLGEFSLVNNMLVRLTCHMPNLSDKCPSSIVRTLSTTLRCVVVNFAVYPSSNSFSMYIRVPD